MKKQIAIILVSGQALSLAKTIQRELGDSVIYSKNALDGCSVIHSYSSFLEEHPEDFSSVVFIGAMGICVRSIAGCIKDKYTDPAVVCVDSNGRFVIPVLAGHIGGG